MNQKNYPSRRSMLLLFLLLLIFDMGCSKKDTFQTVSERTAGTKDPLIVKRSKPNIILLLADDVGYEIPSCNGGQSYQTPNLDNMAQMGIRFTNFHATPLCSPSRFMLLTGKYNFRNYEQWGIMDTSNRTIANMFKDAGYKTCVAGKWQLDGGDASVHAFGFDDYMIWTPFTTHAGENVPGRGSKYKDPVIYQDGAFLPASLTKGKFGEDVFENFVEDFIDSNKTNPFFIYYPICLVHEPFAPPPNNPDFAIWDPKGSTPDVKYFPDMVNYMDTKVGEVLSKVTSAGIAQNTLVILLGDNGTDANIVSLFNGQEFRGGKSNTNEAGTKVPLLMWWQGKIMPGTQNDFLLDLTDFLPTLANIAGIPKPVDYGTLDGVSFYKALKGDTIPTRQWIYCYFNPNMLGHPRAPSSWVQDTAYKLYHETDSFYHFSQDLKETHALSNDSLTQQEKMIKRKMRTVLSTMHS